MALLPECRFLREIEISSYQRDDFETFWADAEPLSDDQLGLFGSPYLPLAPPQDLRDMEPVLSNDPMLSATFDDEDTDDDSGYQTLGPASSAAKVETQFLLDPQPDVIYYDETEEEQEAEQERQTEQEARPRRRQRQRNRRRCRQTTDDDEDEDDQLVSFSNGKPKLYAERPFKNPKQERARLNAINAKKNRDRKKNETARLQKDLDGLREQNAAMTRSLQRFELRAAKAEKELAAIKALLQSANLGDLLKLVSGK